MIRSVDFILKVMGVIEVVFSVFFFIRVFDGNRYFYVLIDRFILILLVFFMMLGIFYGLKVVDIICCLWILILLCYSFWRVGLWVCCFFFRFKVGFENLFYLCGIYRVVGRILQVLSFSYCCRKIRFIFFNFLVFQYSLYKLIC